MILELFETAARWLFGSGASATALAIILVAVLYGRRVLKVGGYAASWFQTLLVTLAIIGLTLGVGVFELDLRRLMELVHSGAELLGGVIG